MFLEENGRINIYDFTMRNNKIKNINGETKAIFIGKLWIQPYPRSSGMTRGKKFFSLPFDKI
jgi:hypothetical protein